MIQIYQKKILNKIMFTKAQNELNFSTPYITHTIAEISEVFSKFINN